MEQLLKENEKLKQEIKRLTEQLMRKKDSETVVQLACGSRHSLALFTDGTIKGWGNNEFGQSQAQSFLAEGKKAIQIACGQRHSVALLDDGTLRGWGNGLVTFDEKTNNLLDFPQFTQKVIRIICGDLASCALLEDKRTVVTWGHPFTEENTIITYDKDVKQIECGGINYFIALFKDGTIKIHGYFAFPSIEKRDKLLTNIEENHKLIKRIACGFNVFLALSDEKFISYGDYSVLGFNLNERIKYLKITNVTHFGCGIIYCVIVTNNNHIRIFGSKFIQTYIAQVTDTKKDSYEALLKTDFEVTSNVAHLACGPHHFTILLENGDFISHGLNDFGQCNKPAFLSNKSFEKKYLKYKNKYLQLK
jgi:alpha-tubulin suppressor-like RCC1 family protein